METLNKMLLRGRELELFKGLKVDKSKDMEEVIHLLFYWWHFCVLWTGWEAILNLISILLSFQAVSDLIINLTKSELVKMGDQRDALYVIKSHGV